MRNRKWDFIWGILALAILIGSIVKGNNITKLLGFEVNSWLYRGIWMFIAISNLGQFIIRKKQESKTDN